MANAKEPGEKKSIFRKWWFWVLAVLIIGALGSGASDSTTTTGTDNSGGQTATESSQPKQEEKKTEYKVGDVVKLNNHEIVVNSVNKNYKSGNQFEKPQNSANTFVVVDLTITNTGNSDLPANEYGFKLEDETGTQRNGTFLSTLDGRMEWVTLSPGGKITGKIPYEAKAGSSVLKLHYSPGAFGGEEVVISLL